MNFARGANPPRGEWKAPPQKSAAEQKQTFGYFEDLVRYMKTFPNVRFITGSQAVDLYPDLAQGRDFSSSELAEIATSVTSKVSFQERGQYALSPGEVLELLSSYTAQVTLKESAGPPVRLNDPPYGPSSAPPTLDKPINVSLTQFLSAVVDVRNFVATHHEVPNAVWLGSTPVPPEDYLVVLAELSSRLLSGQELPQTVAIGPAELATTKYIASDSVKLWDWPIFPQGFHSTHLMDMARLQAWTLKPGILVRPQVSASAKPHD